MSMRVWNFAVHRGTTIEEIKQNVRDNSYLAALLQKGLDRAAAGAVGVAIGQMADLPGIASQALTVGGGLAAASVVVSSRREWREKQAKIEQNQLFFYYGAAKRLEARDPDD